MMVRINPRLMKDTHLIVSTSVLNGGYHANHSFIKGYFRAVIDKKRPWLSFKNPIAAQGLFLVLTAVGYACSVSFDEL